MSSVSFIPGIYQSRSDHHADASTLKAVDCLKETAIQRQMKAEKAETRRKLLQELEFIQKQLDYFMIDSMSDQILQWLNEYREALNKISDEPEIVLKKFILRMQELLKDPSFLTNSGCLAPLDDKALLGSDGRTYSYMIYSFYLLTVNEKFRQRSPLEPNNPKPFTVKAHNNVRVMIQWLSDHGSRLHCEEVETIYGELRTKGALPDIATDDHGRRRLNLRAYADEIEAEEEAILRIECERLESLKRSKRNTQFYAKQLFEELSKEAQTQFESTYKELDELSESDLAIMAVQTLAVENLERRTEELARGQEEFQKKSEELDKGIVRVDQGLANLESAINKERESIRKRDKDWIKDICIAAAIVGGCTLGTFAIQSFLGSLGSSVGGTVLPLNTGGKMGVMFGITI